MAKLLRVLTTEAQSSIPNTHRHAEAHNCVYSRPTGSDSPDFCRDLHSSAYTQHGHIEEKHIIKINVIF